MKTKKFDCVEMKHAAAQRVQRKLSGMTQVEKLGFWKSREREMLVRQLAAQEKLKKAL